MINPKTIITTQSSVHKQSFTEEERRSSQNFENTLNITNFDSDSRQKDIRNSSISHFGYFSSARLRSSYIFSSVELEN